MLSRMKRAVGIKGPEKLQKRRDVFQTAVDEVVEEMHVFYEAQKDLSSVEWMTDEEFYDTFSALDNGEVTTSNAVTKPVESRDRESDNRERKMSDNRAEARKLAQSETSVEEGDTGESESELEEVGRNFRQVALCGP